MVVGWEETVRDKCVSEPCTASQTILPYSHPSWHKQIACNGIGYVSQEGTDYQFEQCYPTSPYEREELSRDKGPVSVTVSVNDSKERPMQRMLPNKSSGIEG